MVYADALVLGDLRDHAHGALFDALAARDAGLFVLNGHNAVDDGQDFLRANVHADSAADALVGLKNRMGHGKLLTFKRHEPVIPAGALCMGAR